MAAVRRQAARFQKHPDAFAGTDPGTMERALQALQRSQMEFDQDGAQWERAVIAACKASGVKVPKIVRHESETVSEPGSSASAGIGSVSESAFFIQPVVQSNSKAGG
jgi:hypothetical protein